MVEPVSDSELPLPDDDQSSSRPPRIWQSADILEGAEMVLIEHQGEFYQLRATRQDKLVLNK